MEGRRSMNLHHVEPGDLLAYLDTVDLPHVDHALQESADLRQRLASLRQTDRALRTIVGGLPIPDPQDLVDVATGQATPAQQIRVAAYVRANPVGRDDLAELVSAPPKPSRLRLPRFAALPLAAALGTRSGARTTTEQAFYASELAVQVVVRIVPPSGDLWQLAGYVTRNDQPASQVRVTLRAADARPRPRRTDADGFFTFTRLRAGVYHLQAQFEQGVILVPAITLTYA